MCHSNVSHEDLKSRGLYIVNDTCAVAKGHPDGAMPAE